MFWYQCSICGVQEYESKLIGITIESWSEREYDEYGTYKEWKKINQKEKCDHDFSVPDHHKTKKSLRELKKANS
ncbi:MAG: hypothetical protein GY777_32680 [Candidatus Brocadiaceae bacterium]|nr:hypothetical protein [Candidatus Brocadiaceae bacterium]